MQIVEQAFDVAPAKYILSRCCLGKCVNRKAGVQMVVDLSQALHHFCLGKSFHASKGMGDSSQMVAHRNELDEALLSRKYRDLVVQGKCPKAGHLKLLEQE